MIATALHECGHVLVHQARHKRKNERIAGVSKQDQEHQVGRYSKRTKKRHIAEVTEEIEAWERGWELGKRLKIRIAKKYYENVRVRALMTYMRWSGS